MELLHSNELDMPCLTPFHVQTNKQQEKIPVPCGKCPECVKRKVSAWSFRLMQESRQSMSALFVTLTYDTQNVPISKKGFMNLNKRDVQLFFKRLRKVSEHKIKYYLAGEYGGRSFRPHYHIILFNATIENIEKSWMLGSINYGDERGVNEASCGYTLKYISKQKRIPLHANDDRQPEFALMSKGMGANYLTEAVIKYHKNDLLNNVNCKLKDGKIISMPRYYKDKIYSETERDKISFFGKIQAQKLAVEKEKKELKIHGDDLSRVKSSRDKAAFQKMEDQSKQRNKI